MVLLYKTCVKRPLSKRQKIGFQDQISLNAGQKYCRMLHRKHSAILSTFIKLKFVIKPFLLFIFEWPFYTGFTVLLNIYKTLVKQIFDLYTIVPNINELPQRVMIWYILTLQKVLLHQQLMQYFFLLYENSKSVIMTWRPHPWVVIMLSKTKDIFKKWIQFLECSWNHEYFGSLTINILNIKIIFNLGIKTILYLKYNLINSLVGVWNGKAKQPAWTWTANGANKRLVLHVRLRCGSLSITTTASLLVNEFDARSVLHGQVSLAAVNQICVSHEAMNGCKKSKIH